MEAVKMCVIGNYEEHWRIVYKRNIAIFSKLLSAAYLLYLFKRPSSLIEAKDIISPDVKRELDNIVIRLNQQHKEIIEQRNQEIENEIRDNRKNTYVITRPGIEYYMEVIGYGIENTEQYHIIWGKINGIKSKVAIVPIDYSIIIKN
jgi:hypothetical protein